MRQRVRQFATGLAAWRASTQDEFKPCAAQRRHMQRTPYMLRIASHGTLPAQLRKIANTPGSTTRLGHFTRAEPAFNGRHEGHPAILSELAEVENTQ